MSTPPPRRHPVPGRWQLGRVQKGLIGLGISGAFIAFTFRGVDLVEVRARFREIDTGMLVPVLVCLVLIFLFKAFRWQYQMSPLKRIGFGWSLNAVIIGYMANNALPLRGGDLLRAHLLGRQEKIGTATVFATVALERIFDVLALVSIALVALLMIPLPGWMLGAVMVLAAVLLGGSVGIMVFRRPPARLETWWTMGARFVPDKLREALALYTRQLRLGLETSRGKVRLINLYLLAVAEWVLWGLLIDFSLRTLDIHLSMAAFIGTLIATDLAVIVPAAPANLGVFEYAVMTTLEFFQFDKSVALSGALILHAIFVIPASLVGLLFFMKGWLAPKGSQHEEGAGRP